MENNWVVRRNGAARASGVFATKNEAVTFARKQVAGGLTDYAIVHDNTGQIEEKIEK